MALSVLLAPDMVFAQGDEARGKQLYESRCMACHSVDSNRIGPMHGGVFGRRAGVVPGYDYSAALKASQVTWNERTLDAWLWNPESVIPGQRMGYQLGDAAERGAIIEYLKSVSPR
jgi:cytochrome c